MTAVPKNVRNAKAADPTEQVFAEYMANIIKKIPLPDELNLLTGPGNAQVSFFFQSPTTGEINDNLYNNILSRRVKGGARQYDVQQAELTASVFTNDYADVYSQLRFSLSQADQATMQRLVAETAGNVRKLTPLWNKWVQAVGKSETPPVGELDATDTEIALIQMTATVQGPWLNPDYKQRLIDDPSYPYVHMNEFDQIFSLIPLSVPAAMRDAIKDVYNAQGAQGGLTARRSNATQTQRGVINNVQNPTAANGGLPLTNSTNMIPGITFQPDDPTVLTTQLGTNPPSSNFGYAATVTKSSSTELEVSASAGGGIRIPILSFFGLDVGGSVKGSIFQADYAGSRFSVEVSVNNPTVSPQMTMKPLLYNTSTEQGWLNATPIQQALANGSKTDVTGWVFDGGAPPYEFGQNGDFGLIESMVLSQFMQLQLTFEECESKKVQEYFEQHASATFSFLGIPLGGASESSKYQFEYNAASATKITVTMKPNPPGYTPGGTGSGITGSLCNLVAVGVTYPIAS
ncbi:MAG: hypothetical protein AAGE94_09720 [Acidobacteriota bacterium]